MGPLADMMEANHCQAPRYSILWRAAGLRCLVWLAAALVLQWPSSAVNYLLLVAETEEKTWRAPRHLILPWVHGRCCQTWPPGEIALSPSTCKTSSSQSAGETVKTTSVVRKSSIPLRGHG